MKKEIIETIQLDVAYPSQKELVFQSLNLRVEAGERILIIGENGVGKTALLKTISGLIPPKGGEVKLMSKEIKNWKSRDMAKKIAFVGSRNVFNSLIRLQDFIAFGRYPFTNWLAEQKKSDREAVEYWVKRCGLEGLSDSLLVETSEGERQKAIIARALAQETDLLILDEPGSHLDIKNTLSILQLLREESEKGKTLIFSSHQIEIALGFADKIWLCHEKQLIDLSPQEFLGDRRYQQIIFGEDYYYDPDKKSFQLKNQTKSPD